MITKAIILAGGKGERLGPITKVIPKPMLPVRGKPILQHCIENLKKHGITKIILSVGYKSENIINYFKDGKKFGVNITYCKEESPLGTGGAIKKSARDIKGDFLVLWGDNISDLNISKIKERHQKNDYQITMALVEREDFSNFGVVAVKNNSVVSFQEKPQKKIERMQLVNAGAIILNSDLLHKLPEGKSSMERDFYELLPANSIQAYIHQGQWFPTDTKEKYEFALQHFKRPIDYSTKKVIIADVDDTICESCQVMSDEMANQINSMIQQGYTFAFLTGTEKQYLLEMVSSKLRGKHYLLAAIGTECIEVEVGGENKEVYKYNLSEEQINEIVKALEELTQKYNILPVTNKDDQIQNRETQVCLSAIGRHAPKEQKAAYDPNGNKRLEWIQFLKTILDENKYDMTIGGTTSIDITPKGIDKAWGIKHFCEKFGIELENVLFFGDKIHPGGNDFPASKVVDVVSVKNPEETLGRLKEL